MPDLYLDWKDDFQLTAGGDLRLSTDDESARQRIIRRLFTAVRGYVWHVEYGAGLIQRIGNVATVANIAAICRAQLKLEQAVAQVPIPSINVRESTVNQGLFIISISYTSSKSNKTVALKFEVPTK